MPQIHSKALNFYAMFYEVRRKLAEVTAAFFTDLEVYSWLNQGQIDIATKSRCLKKNVTVTTDSNQEYDLKTSTNSFGDIIDISEDGVSFKKNGTSWDMLSYTTKWRLNREQPSWRGVSSGTPNEYYYDKVSKTIGLYPKPNSSNQGAYLLIEGVHLPKILNAGTASTGAATTLTLATGSSTVPYPSTTADYYNNLYMEIYGGTGAGNIAKITDYDGAGKCTIDFTTTPDTTSVYGMIPKIPESMHHLMILYALGNLWKKGGIRVQLGDAILQQYYQELAMAIGDYLETDDEDLIKDSYR